MQPVWHVFAIAADGSEKEIWKGVDAATEDAAIARGKRWVQFTGNRLGIDLEGSTYRAEQITEEF